jgi:hypothetical protein
MTGVSFSSPRYRFSDWEEAQDYYHSQGMTDGLPIVPPTEHGVCRMLEYMNLQPSDIIAREETRGKVFTAEKVAINAVMAGCKPEYMPVVVAAVQAMSEKPLNLHAITTCTDGAAILAVVSGPIAGELAINSGAGMMGHGFRANATIGRTLGLLKTNVYGSVPQEMDKSTFGYPGKYGFCFAEDDDSLPWEPLRVEKGFPRESSTVTLFAAESPMNLMVHNTGRPEEILTAVADGLLGLGYFRSELMLVIAPELLDHLSRAEWKKPQVKEFILQKAQRTIREWNTWHRLEKLYENEDPDRLLPVVQSAERMMLVGAGGSAGAYVSLVASWGGSLAVTKEIKKGR